MGHTCHTLEIDNNLATAVRIDIVCNKDVAYVAIVTLAPYAITRGYLSARPCLLSLDTILSDTVIGMVTRAIYI